MYTTHGHQIPNTPVEGERPQTARCGGPGICHQCSTEILHGLRDMKKPHHDIHDTRLPNMRPSDIARLLVAQYINARIADDPEIQPLTLNDIYVVWFCKTLKNWKALIVTNIPDGMFFEVTYNGESQETYLDAYVKWENVVIPDGGL